MIVADTNALLWFLTDVPRLGPKSRDVIDSALADDMLAASAFSFWEIALLVDRGRIALDQTPVEFRREALSLGMIEIAVTGAIGIAAVGLAALHGDPADRIIAATALAHEATLLTADRRLLDWNGPLKRHDARL